MAGEQVSEFWEQVALNLKARRIRMLFVADRIPENLARVIEFLNEQTSPAEVLGIEVRQYLGGEHVAYVPRVVGRTSEAVTAKRVSKGVRWTHESFVDAARDRCTPEELELVHALLDHAEEHGSGRRLKWGTGVTPGVGGWYDLDGRDTGCWAPGPW